MKGNLYVSKTIMIIIWSNCVVPSKECLRIQFLKTVRKYMKNITSFAYSSSSVCTCTFTNYRYRYIPFYMYPDDTCFIWTSKKKINSHKYNLNLQSVESFQVQKNQQLTHVVLYGTAFVLEQREISNARLWKNPL